MRPHFSACGGPNNKGPIVQAFLLFNESGSALQVSEVISTISEQFGMKATITDTTDDDGVAEVELTITTNEGDEGRATIQVAAKGGHLQAFKDLQDEIAEQDPDMGAIFKRSKEDIAIIGMGEEVNSLAATLTAIAAAEVCKSGVLLIDIPSEMLDGDDDADEESENKDDPEAGMIQTAWFPTADDFADQFFEDEGGCGDDCGCDDEEEGEHHHH